MNLRLQDLYDLFLKKKYFCISYDCDCNDCNGNNGNGSNMDVKIFENIDLDYYNFAPQNYKNNFY